ncbi:MAG: hypothetical protein LQ340_001599 [Diploschistes diacapsis]|nr:MAG: hypothetical protein LQ340_001599 [Diploschistes diacapsis]
MNDLNQRSRNSLHREGRGGEKIRLKGLFADGIWKCDCDPRLPAEHFPTKNGGPNHGRWFYTCQKSQPKRCGFFLWDDHAKNREAHAVLSNSRTEPITSTEPSTPTGNSPTTRSSGTAPMTPFSNSKAAARLTSDFRPPSRSAVQNLERESNWLFVADEDLDDQDLKTFTDKVSMPPPRETPSKAAKTSGADSPSKRRFAEFQDDGQNEKFAICTPTKKDVFTTPNERFRGRDNPSAAPGSTMAGPGSLMTPSDTQRTTHTGPPRTEASMASNVNTPTKNASIRDKSPLGHKSANLPSFTSMSSFGQLPTASPRSEEPPPSQLATEILDTLRDLHIELTIPAVRAVKAIAHRHVQKLKAIEKGRDVSRDAFKRRDARVRDLEAEIGRLKGSGR